MRWLAITALLATTAQGAAAADRVISVGGGVTEIVTALGARDRLVGVDTTSTFPPALRRLPQVGYLRALGAEGVLSLRPDLLIAAEEAGPPTVLAQIGGADVRVVRVGDGYSAEAVLQRIAGVANALGMPAEGVQMAAAVRADLEAVRAAVEASPTRPTVLFLLSLSAHGTPQASGRGTAADAMIRLAGGRNVIDSYAGYRPLSTEHIAGLDPAVILTTTESIAQLGGADAVLSMPGISATRAAATRRVVALDTLYLLGFGPRIAHALREVALAIEPARTVPPLPQRAWTVP